MSDDRLLSRTEAIAAGSRVASALLVEHLAELDRRQLPLKRGFGSLYEYAALRLRLSEGAAYRHIRAARAVRTMPAVLEMLRDGRLSVDSLVLLHPHLDAPDAAALVKAAAGLRSRQLEALLAERTPETPKRDVIRRMGPPPPSPNDGMQLGFEAAAPAGNCSPPPAASSLGAQLGIDASSSAGEGSPSPEPQPVRFSFTADAAFLSMVMRARQVLRHKYPDGRLEGVFHDSLEALLDKKDRSRRQDYPRFPQRD